MDSLTKILEKIDADNKTDCENIIAAAKSEAEQIILDAQKKADQIRADIIAEGEKQIKNKITRHESSAELDFKRKLLAARVEIINSTITKLLESFVNMPREEYFKILLSLAEKYAETGDATLALSDVDFAAMPTDFAQKLSKTLENKGVITVTGGGNLPYGGFKLCYAETVLNCGFDALLNDRIDDAKDTLSKIFFA